MLAWSDHAISLASLVVAIAAIVIAFAAAGTAALFAVLSERRESDRHRRERRANVRIIRASFDRCDGKVGEYTVDLRNDGPAIAHGLNLVVVDGDGADAKRVGELGYHEFYEEITLAVDETRTLVVQLGMANWSRSLRFRLLWTDDNGEQSKEGPHCPRGTPDARGRQTPLVPYDYKPKRDGSER